MERSAGAGGGYFVIDLVEEVGGFVMRVGIEQTQIITARHWQWGT